MLAALNRLPVAPGERHFVSAGVLHAIGGGVFIVECRSGAT
jgi:mannose-6-phosphate isomerase class I